MDDSLRVRYNHIIKRIDSIMQPSNLMFFDCETLSSASTLNTQIECHYLFFGCTLAYRLVNGERTRQSSIVFSSAHEFWAELVKRIDPSRPLWVFSHNLGFDLTIVEAWDLADEYGLDIDYAVLDDPPTFIHCTHKRGKVVFVDTFNFWKNSLEELGKSVGVEKGKMPNTRKITQEWIKYCRTDVEIIARSVDSLITWLDSNNLGSMRYTIASIALNIYKHRFMPVDSIYVHTDDEVLMLERESYHGGLTHCYYLGEITNKVYKLDVNSLYPYVMLNKYPSKLLHSTKNITPKELFKEMDLFGAVARVKIETNDYPYPYYDGKRLLEAVGNYETVLCGDELVCALRLGHIKYVKTAAFYEMRDIFSSYVNYFWEKRLEFKLKGDFVAQYFCKILLNSLYGKFGQRGYDWRTLTYDVLNSLYTEQGIECPKKYRDKSNIPTFGQGISQWTPEGLSDPLIIRQIGNLTQVKLTVGEHYESCPIIASYVTSYARSYIRSLTRVAGLRNVYYTDTDSLFVSSKGFNTLQSRNYISDMEIGKLKLEETTNYLRIYGPKDYIFGPQRVCKGIRRNARPVCSNCDGALTARGYCRTCKRWIDDITSWEQLQFEGLRSVLKRTERNHIKIARVIKTLNREYNKGTVNADGWTSYPVIVTS